MKDKGILHTLGFMLFFTSCLGQPHSSEKEGITGCVEKQVRSLGKLYNVPTYLGDSKNSSNLGHYRISINTEKFILNESINLSSQDSVKKWLQKIEIDAIKIYGLNSENQAYFIICSEEKEATGLASNFYNWVLIDAKKSSIIALNLMSLSGDVRMFYLKDGTFYFTLFDFGDDFYHSERNWENPQIRVTTFKVHGTSLEKVDRTDTFCKCK